MEEEKAVAYYDELTRKGEGAARFKQGLGFSSASNDAAPSRGSALSSSSSYLSSFVKASSPSKASELQKEAQLASIQNKLTKKRKPGEVESQSQSSSRVSRDRDRDDRHSSRRSRDRHSRRSRSRDNDRRSRRRSQSRDRDRHSRRWSRSLIRSRSRSRSRSRDDHRRRRGHRSISRERDRERVESRRRRRSRSESPKRRRSEKRDSRNGSKVENERIHNVDYAKLIEGYDKMMPTERVKAKMKLQISETVKKDEANMGSGWERFDFDKDAPLDDDEEIEAAEDDAVLVKHMGQSFRFSAVEARKEDDLKAAHDRAMFGAPLLPPSPEKDEEDIKSTKEETPESATVSNLISDQVLTMQQGSWRDRIRKT